MIKVSIDRDKLHRITSAVKSAASTTGNAVRNGIGNAAGFAARHLHHAELELHRIPHDAQTLVATAKATTKPPVTRHIKTKRRK